MTKAEIKEALQLHERWTKGASDGACAFLRRANLNGASLRHAILTGANLYDANLIGADLRDADLQGAILHGANLTGADLTGANLCDANLIGANLRRARGIYELDMGDPRGYRPVAVEHDLGWMVCSGCRWLTVPEALAHWSDPGHKDPEIAARYVRAINALPPIGTTP